MKSRKPPSKRNKNSRNRARRAVDSSNIESESLLFGVHAVSAALGNPARICRQLLMTRDGARRMEDLLAAGSWPDLSMESVEKAEIDAQLPAGAVHQGILLLADPLAPTDLDDVTNDEIDGRSILIALDQVTDPHNVGAILRSAAVFGASAVIVPARHAPPLTSTLAKAASGATEIVPLVRVANLARALDQLAKQGYWRIGLDAAGDTLLANAQTDAKTVLVLGAEGSGLRRLTAEKCDVLCRLPMASGPADKGAVDSLNVSNAAAVALYELARQG